MIQLITWRQYLIFIGGATLLYYGIIMLLYYRDELKILFNNKRGQSPEDPPHKNAASYFNFFLYFMPNLP